MKDIISEISEQLLTKIPIFLGCVFGLDYWSQHVQVQNYFCIWKKIKRIINIIAKSLIANLILLLTNSLCPIQSYLESSILYKLWYCTCLFSLQSTLLSYKRINTGFSCYRSQYLHQILRSPLYKLEDCCTYFLFFLIHHPNLLVLSKINERRDASHIFLWI